MGAFLLVAALAARAAFPPFAVDGVPGRYSEALPNLFMSSVTRAGCADGVGDTALDEVTSGAITGCGGEPACVSRVSSTLLVDFVVLGSLRREGSAFRMKLDVIDTSRRNSAKKLEKSFDSPLNGVPGAISELSTSLCKVLQTQKPAVPAIVAAERRARKDPPPAVPPPSRPAVPTDDLSLELPPIDAPNPLEQQASATPPPATPARESELVIPLTPPPSLPVVSGSTGPHLPVVSAPPTPLPMVSAPPPAPLPVVRPPLPPAIVGPMPPPPAPTAEPPPPPPEESKVAATLPPPVLTPPPATPPPGPSAGEIMRKLPWNWILIGAAAVSTGVGIYYGASSQTVWGNDHPTTVGGVTQHTISRVDAAQANKQAVNANISFAVGGALAAGGGVMFLVKF